MAFLVAESAELVSTGAPENVAGPSFKGVDRMRAFRIGADCEGIGEADLCVHDKSEKIGINIFATDGFN